MRYDTKKLDPKRLVGEVSEIQCTICKNVYIPVNSDISLNGSQYFKNCKECRARRLELKKQSLLHKSICHNPL